MYLVAIYFAVTIVKAHQKQKVLMWIHHCDTHAYNLVRSNQNTAKNNFLILMFSRWSKHFLDSEPCWLRITKCAGEEKMNTDVSVLQPVYISWTPAQRKEFPFMCLIRWCDDITLCNSFSSEPPAPSYKVDLKSDRVNIYDPAWQ